jgi:ornithine cyclodeaminase
MQAVANVVGQRRTAVLDRFLARGGEYAVAGVAAVVAAFDPSTGEPLALMDGTSITAIRTAAGSALSTRILARPDAAILAVIGTGVQAQSHLRAIPRVRPIREIRMAGRSADAVRALASRMAEELEVPVRPTDSLEEAMHGADVVCACTHSPQPVVRRQWLSPGAHVTSVGMTPEGREVDGPTVADALVVVEQRSAAFAPFPTGSNDLAFALRDGLIGEDHIHAEIGELVTGAKPGRTDRDRITLYKSVGVAVQDAAAAALVLEAARNRGTGTEVIV